MVDPALDAAAILGWLADQGTEAERQGLSRFGIPTAYAFGVPMRALQAMAKEVGRDHRRAADLWVDGRHEARIMAILTDEPELVDAAQMDHWVSGMQDWAIVDAAAFHLFDRSPDRWSRPAPWLGSDQLYVRRAGLALIWALALHDKAAADQDFIAHFPAISEAASDPRPHVAKAVTMAVRAMARRAGLRQGLSEMIESWPDKAARPAWKAMS